MAATKKRGDEHIGFAALESKLRQQGVRDPAALAASIGRKKYGKESFQKLSAAGRKKGG